MIILITPCFQNSVRCQAGGTGGLAPGFRVHVCMEGRLTSWTDREGDLRGEQRPGHPPGWSGGSCTSLGHVPVWAAGPSRESSLMRKGCGGPWGQTCLGLGFWLKDLGLDSHFLAAHTGDEATLTNVQPQQRPLSIQLVHPLAPSQTDRLCFPSTLQTSPECILLGDHKSH